MFTRVISLPDGRVVFYYSTKEITYRENEEPEVTIRVYNKKEVYGRLALSSSLFDNIHRFGRY